MGTRKFIDLSNYKFTESDMARFTNKFLINDETGCYEWLRGALSDDFYPQFSIKSKRVQAHRAIYIHFFGPIKPGYEVDHVCTNSMCVNPYHLQQVTKLKNLQLRGWRNAASARIQKKSRLKSASVKGE